MAAVCFPIMLPLAESLDANLYVTIGAVIAGAAAGSSTCFFGDRLHFRAAFRRYETTTSSGPALPMVVPPIIVTIILYLIFGFVL